MQGLTYKFKNYDKDIIIERKDFFNPKKCVFYVKDGDYIYVENGKEVKVGTPVVEGAAVTGTVVENGKGQKVIIFKYKAKKDYRKKQGHRQPYTMVKIESLTGETPVVEEAKAAKKVSASMKKDELIAFANENGIAIDEKATKAVIIETIEAALK